MRSSSAKWNSHIRERLQEFVHYSEVRQLTSNVAELQYQRRFGSLAVLSFFPAEGKTLFCAALAMAYVEIRQAKVLVVDTTTLHNQGSLLLSQCFESSSGIDLVTLDKLRKDSNGLRLPPSKEFRAEKMEVVEPVIVDEAPPRPPSSQQADHTLLQKVSRNSSKNYGLVLMDTTSLNARNKNNMDPLLVARIADASILVVSQKSLQASHLSQHLKVMEDPTLHLMGLLANEGFLS